MPIRRWRFPEKRRQGANLYFYYIPSGQRKPKALISVCGIGCSEHLFPAYETACVQGSTNGIPLSFMVKPMVPLVIPLVTMVMSMVPFALPVILLAPLVSQWCHWLPMVPLVKLPMVPLGEPRTEP